jgi:hypothetical protein
MKHLEELINPGVQLHIMGQKELRRRRKSLQGPGRRNNRWWRFADCRLKYLYRRSKTFRTYSPDL